MPQKSHLRKDETSKFLIDVNFCPRRKAMYWWKDFDEGEVREEFREIQKLNLDLLRIFLDWEEFQPICGYQVLSVRALTKIISRSLVTSPLKQFSLDLVPSITIGMLLMTFFSPRFN